MPGMKYPDFGLSRLKSPGSPLFQYSLGIKITFSAVDGLPSLCHDIVAAAEIVPLAADLFPSGCKPCRLWAGVIGFAACSNKAFLSGSILIEVVIIPADLMSALGSSLVTGLAEIKYSSADILPALEHLSVLDRCIIPAAVDPEKSRHTGSGPAEEIPGTVDGLEFVFDNIAVPIHIVDFSVFCKPAVFLVDGFGLFPFLVQEKGLAFSSSSQSPRSMVNIGRMGIDDRHSGSIRADAERSVIVNAVSLPVIIDRIAAPDAGIVRRDHGAVLTQVPPGRRHIDPGDRIREPGTGPGQAARVQTLRDKVAAVPAFVSIIMIIMIIVVIVSPVFI